MENTTLEEKISSKKTVLEAYKFAEEAHRGQSRKTGEDYINHCIAVANILTEYGADDETIAAGYLHDVLEDTKTTYEQLKEKFGIKIAFLIDGVTEAKNERATFTKIKYYSAIDRRVLMIKLADRIHNIEGMINTMPDFQKLKEKYHYPTKTFLVSRAREFGFNEMAKRLEKLLLTLE